MEKIIYPRFIIVKDNFYEKPNEVFQTALNSNFYEPDHATGYRSDKVYHEKGVKIKLEKILGLKITRWDIDPIEENGVFYYGFSKGKKKEIPGVHSDEPYNDVTIVIYITPDIPVDCGTSLWKHKQTGLTDPVSPADARRLKLNFTKLRAQLEKESKDASKWIETDKIGYLFNRMVAYPSGAFHSASNHYGNRLSNGRIYQTFRVGVDWSSFKMNDH
jgi:hypothetical protein